MMRADEAHIVNTSSVNGFWASVGLGASHTAYSAAKFAVKGFTEALMTDLRLNAPHIKSSVVMPGHIGTSIVSNSRKIQSGTESEQLSPNEILSTRQRLNGMGIDTAPMSDDDIQKLALDRARLSRRRADHGGGRGKDHPRRRQGRTLANSRRRRCPQARRAGAAGPGKGLHAGILQELYGRGGLASRLAGCGSDLNQNRGPPG